MKKTQSLTKAEQFYKDILQILDQNKIPFMIGGTYAFTHYTDIDRPTKDLDLFCKASDYPKILQAISKKGYKGEITDARWLAKILQNGHFIDLIFGNISNICPVDDGWFKYAPTIEFLGLPVKLMPPEEMLFSKSFRGEREKYDGADVNHLILKQGAKLNWKRLLRLMDPYWEVLFSHISVFRFMYPSERNIIPQWLIKELLTRVDQQLKLPVPQEKVCRGNLFSRSQYEIDVKKWGYQAIT